MTSKMEVLTHSYQVHKNLSCHWGGEFRPDMLTMPASIRAQTVDPQNIPVLAMTATLTPDEVKEVEKELCIDSEKVRVRKYWHVLKNVFLFVVVHEAKYLGNPCKARGCSITSLLCRLQAQTLPNATS